MEETSISNTSTRLVIQRLELENFKSYGGFRVIGPFHPRFSCIVGSNGSGKSNIVDAMLFVFGKRAQQLRMKKVQDLIHNSGSMPDCRFCRVVVYFCDVSYSGEANRRDASSFTIVPNSMFSIGREAYADGGSKYLMNGSNAPRDKIVSLLQSKGVDLDHNRFLILQGEVEQIALLKPVGRRNDKDEVIEGGLLEFIDDIIGTNKYIAPIKELRNAMDESKQQLTSFKNLMDISWNKIVDMIPDVTEAKTGCNLELERLRWALIKIRSQESEFKFKMDEASKNQQIIKAEWAEYKAATASIRDEEEIKENELLDATKIKKKAEKAFNKLNEKFNVIEDREMELAMKIKKAKLERDKIIDKIKKFNKECETSTTQVEKLEATLPKLVEEENRLKSEYEESKNAYEEFLEDQKEQLSLLTQEKLKMEREAESPLSQFREWKSQMEAVNRRLKNLEKQIEQAQRSETDQQKKIEENMISIDSLNLEHETLQSQLTKNVNEKNNLNKKIMASDEHVANTKGRATQAHQQWNELQEKFSKSRNHNMKQKLEASLQRHVKDGQLPGYIGNLWNINIPEKFGPAFAANGANSDVFLTETTSAAEAIIRVAREERLGRANCLVMPQVVKRYQNHFNDVVNNRKGIPKNATLLIDCVRDVNPTVLLGIFSKVSDTLVAEDMNEARQLAFRENKRHRVVTLAGEIIEKNGVMSGGHSRLQPRGGTHESVDAETVEQANISYREADGAYNKSKEAHQALINKMTYLNETITNTQNRIESVKTDIINKTDEVKTVKTLQQAGKSKKFIEENIAKLRAQIAEEEATRDLLQKDEHTVESAAEEASAKVKQATENIESLGGEKIQSLKAQMQQVSSSLDEIVKNIATKQSEIKKLQIQVKDNQSSRIPLEEKKQKTQEESIAEYEKEREKNENEGFVIVQTQERARKMIDDIDAKITELTKALSEIQARNEESNKKNIEYKEKLDSYITVQKESSVELAKLSSDIKKLQKKWHALPDLDAITKMISMKKGEMHNSGEEENIIPAIEDGQKTPDDALSSLMMDLSAEASHHMLESIVNADVTIFVNLDMDIIEVQSEKAKVALSGMSGINYSIFKSFEENSTEYKTRLGAYSTHSESHNKLDKTLTDLEEKRYREFNSGFVTISCRLKELYQMITFGGDAELEYKNAEKPFEEGIIFSVRPPKKSWKAISNLSGGEKTLSSLSLIFALHFYRPSPIYFLDEIDAALDFRNVAIISHTIALRTQDTQFTIISLRNQMFEKADRLIGTFKRNDLTDTLMLDPKVLSGEDEGISNQE